MAISSAVTNGLTNDARRVTPAGQNEIITDFHGINYPKI